VLYSLFQFLLHFLEFLHHGLGVLVVLERPRVLEYEGGRLGQRILLRPILHEAEYELLQGLDGVLDLQHLPIEVIDYPLHFVADDLLL
jgi:hypothetical protein